MPRFLVFPRLGYWRVVDTQTGRHTSFTRDITRAALQAEFDASDPADILADFEFED